MFINTFLGIKTLSFIGRFLVSECPLLEVSL